MSASIPFDLVQLIARYEVDLEEAKADHRKAVQRADDAQRAAGLKFQHKIHIEREIVNHREALAALTKDLKPEVLDAWWTTAREEAVK